MMLRFVFTLICFTLIFGCGNKYKLSLKKKKELITIVDSLYRIDQRSRHMLNIPDSIYGFNEGLYMNNPKVLKDSLGINYDNYKKQFDSIVALMKASDNSNTEKLIDITKIYGFPNNKRLGVYKSKAYMIFVHAPKIYYPEVESLVIKEYEEKRISEYEKEYIFWHIKGRKGMPPIIGNNGKVILR